MVGRGPASLLHTYNQGGSGTQTDCGWPMGHCSDNATQHAPKRKSSYSYLLYFHSTQLPPNIQRSKGKKILNISTALWHSFFPLQRPALTHRQRRRQWPHSHHCLRPQPLPLAAAPQSLQGLLGWVGLRRLPVRAERNCPTFKFTWD